MSKKQIAGLTIEIGGDTTQLGKALNDVDKRSKALSTELGEINKLLKLDPTNTELLAQKQKVLTDAIGNTKDRLELLKKAHEDAAEAAKNGSGEAEETMRALEREIIATEQKLNGYENAAKDTEDALNGLGDGAKEAAEKTGDLKKETEKSDEELEKEKKAAEEARQKLGDLAEKGADKATTAIKALAAAAVGAVAAIGKLVLSEAEAADNLVDLSEKTGLSTETLQKYSYAASMSGTTLETLTGAQTKLIKSMASAQKGTGDAAKAFQTLGVRVTDANGQLRNSEDVFNDALNALGHVGNETERDALAMQIFGKSARELNPLINAGEDALKRFGDEAENLGAVVSDDAVGALNDLNTEVKKTEAQFSALKTETAAEFAPIMVELFKRFQELIKKVKAELKKPEVKDAIKKLGKAIIELVEKGIKVVIKILPTLAKIVTLLVSNLKTLLIVLGSLWAIFKGVAVVSKLISAFKTMGTVVKSLTGATASATAAQTGLNTAMLTGKTIAAGLVGAIVALAAALFAYGAAWIKSRNEMLFASMDEITDAVKETTEKLNEAKEAYKNSADEAAASATIAERYVGRLEELEKQTKLTKEEQAEYNGLVAALREIMPELSLEQDEHTGMLKNGAAALREQIDLLKERLLLEAQYDLVKESVAAQVSAQKNLIKAQKTYNAYFAGEVEKFKDIIYRLNNGDSKIKASVTADEFNWAKNYADAMGGLSMTTWEFEKQQKAAAEALNEAQVAYDKCSTETDELIVSYQEAASAAGILSGNNAESTETVDGLADATANLTDKIKEASTAAAEAGNKHFETLKNAAQNMFDVIDTGNARSMEELIGNMKKNKEAVDKWHENLKKLYERGASAEFVQYLENLGLGYAETVDTIANSTDEELEELTSTWTDAASDAEKLGKDWGRAVYQGMIKGMRLESSNVISELHGLATRMRHTMQNDLGIHSPSTVFEGMGGNSMLGLIGGIRKKLPELREMMHSASDTMRQGYDPGALTAALPNPLALERSFSAYPSSQAQAAEQLSSGLGAKLDRILAAIEAGQIIAIDGDRFVGATLDRFDNALGRNAILAGRGA